MPFQVTVQRLPDHVRYDVGGPASLKNYFDLIELAASNVRSHGDRRALVDLRGVAGRLVFTDQLFIGEVVAEKLSQMDKVATLVLEDPRSYYSPKVASRKGVSVMSFDDEAAALAWLLEAAA